MRKYVIGTRKKTIDLELPESLIVRGQMFGRVIEVMERSIKTGDSIDQFIRYLENEPGYSSPARKFSWETPLRNMFEQVEYLEKKYDWNRIWCRIVRNYFASIAAGKCQF